MPWSHNGCQAALVLAQIKSHGLTHLPSAADARLGEALGSSNSVRDFQSSISACKVPEPTQNHPGAQTSSRGQTLLHLGRLQAHVYPNQSWARREGSHRPQRIEVDR